MNKLSTIKYVLIVLAIFLTSTIYAQVKPDAVVGKWMRVPKEDMIIEVFKSGNEYKGKIVWTKDNDKKKPLGFELLNNLNFNSRKKMWTNGKIKDPNSGKTYDAEAKIKPDGNLEVLGYMGMKFIGSKKEFRRVR
jgi:uncharacterized protein (DUF2147 family)